MGFDWVRYFPSYFHNQYQIVYLSNSDVLWLLLLLRSHILMIGIVGMFTVGFYLSNARQKHGAVLQNTVGAASSFGLCLGYYAYNFWYRSVSNIRINWPALPYGGSIRAWPE